MRRMQGNIYTRYGHWYVRFVLRGRDHRLVLRGEDGKPIKGKSDARAAAEKILAPLRLQDEALRLRALAAMVAATEERAKPPVAALKLADLWAAFVAVSPRTSAANRPFAEHFVAWARLYGATTAQEINRDAARAYANAGMPGIGATTRNRRVAFLRAAWRALIGAGRLEGANPWAALAPEKEQHYRKRALTREQVRALLAAAPDAEWRGLFALGYFTGLRLGDCATLRRAEIADGVIVRVPNKLKNRAADVDKITIRAAVCPQLADCLAQVPGGGEFVFPRIAKEYQRDRSLVAIHVRKIFEKIGLKNERHRETGRRVVDYGFHSLRHSFVSHSLEAGVPAFVVQASAGHASLRMTEHYMHVSDEKKREYAGLLEL